MAQRVAVPHLPLPDERHRLDAPMGMVREARLVVGRADRLEVVEEQERVEVVESTGADAPAEVDPGAFDDGLGRDDVGDRAR